MEAKSKKIIIPCNLKKVREVKQELNEFLDGYHIEEEEMFNLQLVMDEAVINAIDHGSANNAGMNVEINLSLENNYLKVTIKDYGGKAFNPEFFERIAYKKNWGRGGRGIFLIKQFMDDMRYIFNPGVSTLLSMGKQLTISNDNP